jgi:hypothetical protein
MCIKYTLTGDNVLATDMMNQPLPQIFGGLFEPFLIIA